MFSTHLENFLLFSSNLKLSSANCLNLNQSKILLSGNGLNLHCIISNYTMEKHFEKETFFFSQLSKKKGNCFLKYLILSLLCFHGHIITTISKSDKSTMEKNKKEEIFLPLRKHLWYGPL